MPARGRGWSAKRGSKQHLRRQFTFWKFHVAPERSRISTTILLWFSHTVLFLNYLPAKPKYGLPSHSGVYDSRSVLQAILDEYATYSCFVFSGVNNISVASSSSSSLFSHRPRRHSIIHLLLLPSPHLMVMEESGEKWRLGWIRSAAGGGWGGGGFDPAWRQVRAFG